jgi:hypothetical protein
MSFILWSMGLVLALTVGGLAWTALFYLGCGVIMLVVKHPRVAFGGIGIVLAMVAGFAIWATAYNMESNRRFIQDYQIQHGGH